MLLSCPEEAYRYIGETVLAVLDKPGMNRPIQLRLGLADPDCVLYINTASHEICTVADGFQESGMVAMGGDTAVRCCQGRIDVVSAVAAGEIAAEGDGLRLLDALVGSDDLVTSFAEVMSRTGRHDLLGLAAV